MAFEDKIYKLSNLYQTMPPFIRIPAGWLFRQIPFSLRYGKTYSYYSKLLKSSGFWDDNRKKSYVLEMSKKTLVNAYEYTKYYNELFKKISFDPIQFKDIREIERIPFSDKNILRKHKEELLSSKYNRDDLLYVTTGGTSGIPVELYYIKGVERSREFAFINDMWERIGYSNSDRVVRIRGTVVDHKGTNDFFKYEPVKNRLFLSTYDMYDEHFPKYIEKIKQFKPHFIHSYPSALVVLAHYLLRHEIEISGLKGLLCSSEQFYPGQRELISRAFNAKVYSWYGHSEYTTLAGECEESDNYHIYFEYGYTELVDEKGKVITEPGVLGEIVGTSFEMSGFPIIRYRTGDYAEYVDGKCSCGRNYDLLTNVKGRWLQENIITKKRSTISITALNMHTGIFNNVLQYQFYQDEEGMVVLKIVRSRSYTISDEKNILESFKKKFKSLVEFRVQYVREIEKTSRGKHKFLIQRLPILDYEAINTKA